MFTIYYQHLLKKLLYKICFYWIYYKRYTRENKKEIIYTYKEFNRKSKKYEIIFKALFNCLYK